MSALAHRDGDAPRHRCGHDRLRPELRRVASRAVGPAGTVPQSAGQRFVRDRGRDGHQHPAPQPWRGGRCDPRHDRRPRDRRRAVGPPHQGTRLPDGRGHRRPIGDPGCLSLGARPHRRSRPCAHRGASRRQDRDHRHRAPVRRSEGWRGRRDREDRRPRRVQGDHRDPDDRRRAAGSQRQDGLADLRRAQAGCGPAGRPQ